MTNGTEKLNICTENFKSRILILTIYPVQKLTSKWNIDINVKAYTLEYQTTLPVSWETCYVDPEAIRTKLQTNYWFRIGKGIRQGCILSPLTSVQSTSCEMLGWMNLKLESRLPGEISAASDMQMIYHPNGREWRGTKEHLDEGVRGEWKSWLKTQLSKN